MKNFSPEAAFAYAEMVNNCVSPECTEDFNEDFKKFMDAYENGDDDEPAKVIHGDATPDEIADVVKSAFDKKLDEHERRHQSQAIPLQWSIEKQRAYNDLIKREDLEKIQQAAKAFVDICNRDRCHEKQKRELSSEDFECLLKLADSVRRKMFPDHVCDEEKHESPKPESEKPEANEIYCDPYGERYRVVGVYTQDYGNRILVGLENERFSTRTIPLEQFMNPKFTKV
ncbi:MAG: hypothetical protein IKE46_03875 [Selenomonadaceae bacterium]|nr:hypothetical protein [Selenomonadaceae bacterium]